MTQRQLDLANARLSSEDFGDPKYLHNRIVYKLNERFSIIVKRHQSSVYVLIKSGRKHLKLPMDIFNVMCDAQISVSYLKHFLEANFVEEII